MPNILKSAQVVTFTFFAAASLTTSAANLFETPSEFNLERMAPASDIDMLSAELAGDNISLATGTPTFAVTDIHIPVTTGLSVTLSRYYNRLSGRNIRQYQEFGDWGLDIPRIESTYVQGDTRSTYNFSPSTTCTRALTPDSIVGALGQNIEQFEYFNGVDLIIPAKGGSKLSTSTATAGGHYMTDDHMRVTCKVDSLSQEYFYVETPDGYKYEFRQRIIQSGFALVKKNKAATRNKIIYAVTSVRDTAGNVLSYNYHGQNLTSIAFTPVSGTSQTILELTYNTANRITSASAAGKTWTYSYTDNYLKQVSLPDATSWQYDFPYFSNYAVNIFPASRDSSSANRQCNFITGLDSTYLSVKHPTGATVKLNIGLIVHGSSDVPASYNTYSTAVRDWIYNVNACNAHIAVSSKEISGPRLSNYIWHYNYSNNLPHWSSAGSTYDQTTARFNTNALVDNEKVTQCSSITECAAVPGDLGFERFDLRVLTLTAPDETFTKYYISKRYDYTENQIIATEHFSGTGDLLRRQINSVVRGTLRGDNGINFGVSIANIDASSYPVRKIKTRIVQEGDTYTTLYSDFNAYDVPQQSHQLNDFNSKALYLKTDFTHDTTHWVLNLPTHSYRSDSSTFGTAYQSTSYNSLFKPYQKSILGAVVATYTYNAQGEVAKITYNGSGRSESFEHYYRGRPQKITLPCALTNGCDTVNDSSSNTVIAAQIVNNDGTVQRLTDFNGHQISYSYNAVGWLTKVDYTDPAWSDQTIAYALVNTANDGISGSDIPVGSWRQTITQGNYQKRTYFDGLLRPIFTREMDVNNSATERYQAFQYDDKNRQTFTSFPSGTAPNPLGIATRYDVLGRMLSKTRTSDHSEHSYQYLAGNRIEKTDPNGYATTTTYLAYGSPEQEYPVLIKAADTDDTTINYNFYDQITSITQGHITEYRLYNAAQLLCKTVRPETGITAMGYNTQRQLIWRAEGTTGSTTSCDETAVNASHKVSFSYDNQNQLRTEDFPDAAPDRTYRYDPNGNLLSLSAGNVNWSYLYNSRNLLEKETLTLDSKTFVLDWAYNSLGAISSLIYPTGTTITYAPNALGQPTQAGTYATGISYFPNGEVKQWTYGNGIVRTVQQDSSGRTDMLTDALAAVNTIKLDPAYDNNDNLTQLLNLVDSNYSVTGLTYDAANRLQTANGQWGSGRFTYDGLGNLTSRTYNSTTLGLAYNHLNRLNNLTGAATHSYAYDDRGNITHNGQYALSYNRAQQITSAKSINYVYDGYNRRVKKTNAAGAAYTVYSKSGQLLYRELPDTKTVQSIYLGTKLIAEIDICHAASCGSPITQPDPYQHFWTPC